jgi:hypothetical protein
MTSTTPPECNLESWSWHAGYLASLVRRRASGDDMLAPMSGRARSFGAARQAVLQIIAELDRVLMAIDEADAAIDRRLFRQAKETKR